MALSDLAGGLRGGVAFLTRIPASTREADWDRFRAFPAAFPLVAYPVGAVASVPFLAGSLAGLPDATVAFGYLSVLVVLVGIPHLDGVADLGDAAAAHGAAARRRALKDTETGVGAIVAVAVVLVGLAVAALELAAVPTLAAVGLVVAGEVGAKLGMATVACLGTASHEGLGSAFTRGASPALLLGPVLVSLPAALFLPAVPAAAAAVAAGPLVAIVLVRWADRALGGVNGDVFGATNELGRVLGLHAGVIVWTLS
ncbi:adenosylcobinamide-GDP ribazoletransferase [Natronomonas sp. F2-12]|uniref:Adenosylcobinamide-GDP ribazoletransferase n=1 Tax=Natronomonas aquatica TaxID=2841590 RepID=A0A9R1CRP2_9EURY|nr:adenosylcobinamide-GDP ribazoletransferase [Natronomonas aquatica]